MKTLPTPTGVLSDCMDMLRKIDARWGPRIEELLVRDEATLGQFLSVLGIASCVSTRLPVVFMGIPVRFSQNMPPHRVYAHNSHGRFHVINLGEPSDK